MIWPTKRYDDEDFASYYEKAEKYEMPILFHTGIIAASPIDKVWKISSSYMQPVCLDKICRMFPKLRVIAAHMGDPWYLEAYMTSQKNPNMWLDISGLAIFVKASNIRKNKYLNIRLKPDKLLWGLDEPPEKYLRLLLTWKTLLGEIGISEHDSENIFGKTAAAILALKVIEYKEVTDRVMWNAATILLVSSDRTWDTYPALRFSPANSDPLLLMSQV